MSLQAGAVGRYDDTGTPVLVVETLPEGLTIRTINPYPIQITGVSPEKFKEVEIHCSYAKEQWKRGKKWGIEGMIIVCDAHGTPANGEVYEVDEPSAVTARCQGPWPELT